jgi:hypothetical protein
MSKFVIAMAVVFVAAVAASAQAAEQAPAAVVQAGPAKPSIASSRAAYRPLQSADSGARDVGAYVATVGEAVIVPPARLLRDATASAARWGDGVVDWSLGKIGL